MTAAGVQKAVLAAGGTGGHMFPAEALARELRARGVAVALVTDRRGAGFGGDLGDVETHRISAGGIAGGSATKRLGGLLRLGLGFFQAYPLVRRLAPDAVVGFGAYAAAPTVLAASLLGRRVILHEQNAVVGRANRALAGRADLIATGFARVEGLSAAGLAKTRMTGNPVRPDIQAVGRQAYRAPAAGEAAHVLVVGGSQGAKVFNDAVPAAVAQLPPALRTRLRIAQQVPGGQIEAVQAAYRECGVDAELAGFFDDMPRRLAWAHLVIGRAGASTVAELASARRPAILVPFPHATDDHQSANARALAEADGGWLIAQSELSPAALAERIETLFAHPARLETAAAHAGALAPGDAAGRLADLVCGQANDDGNHDHKDAGKDAGDNGAAPHDPKEAAA
jgi:UDP-N-acetylglucosamine--N-acetylmuramyl-(pentapeptide) pyrophosphoryl-undecaprenol N-acetylglucosamine transferase